MAEQKREISQKRARRIGRFKKLIVLLILAGLLLPTCLSLYLLAKVSGLEKRLDAFYATQEARIEMGREERQLALAERGETQVQTAAETEQAENAESAAPPSGADGEEDGQAVFTGAVRHVYLTFDDGPSVMTDEILDILKRYGVKATFFVNGREDDESLRLYQRIVDEGHTLGMHSYSHRYEQVYASKEAFIEDTLRLQVLLTETTGVRPVFYRFPGGSSNHVIRMDVHELTGWLEEQGIEYFDWNVSSGDASGTMLSAQQILANCTALPEDKDAVILLHDAGSKTSTVAALPSVIEALQAMDGVELSAITGDTEPVHHVE